MSLYSQLVTFLMEKAMQINNLNCKPDLYKDHNASESSKLFNLFEDELKSTRIRQLKINELFTLLLDIAHIQKSYANSDSKTVDYQVSRYLEKYLNNILNKNEEFGKYHALFGFQVFHKMLKNAWLETESYEQIDRLEKLISTDTLQ